jgi:acetyl esterase/lipase
MGGIVDEIRKSFKENDDRRDAGLLTPEDVERFDDIKYGDDPKWQVLDVYRPKNQQGKLPVIISVHGGGWVYGTKETYQFYCMSLAQRGFAVVNYSYRLAPENKFPAQLEDANLVAEFVIRNSDKYGFDTDHIFGVGDSVGGNLLGLYSAFLTNGEYAGKFEFKKPSGFEFKAVALNCGVYHIEKENDQKLMEELHEGKGTKEEVALVEVLDHITCDFPPAFVMTAEGDFLKDNGPMMVDKLLEKEVPHVFRYFKVRGQQPLGHVFHCNMKLDEAHRCNDAECAFFKEFI